jgi:hypothetical protein
MRLIPTRYLKADETNRIDSPIHLHSLIPQSSLDCRSRPIDGVRLASEKIEVAGMPVDQPLQDQGSATGQCESFGLRNPRHCHKNCFLEFGQHASSIPRSLRR